MTGSIYPGAYIVRSEPFSNPFNEHITLICVLFNIKL